MRSRVRRLSSDFAVGLRHTRHHRHAQHLLHLLCRVEAAIELLEEEGKRRTKCQSCRQPDHGNAGLLRRTGSFRNLGPLDDAGRRGLECSLLACLLELGEEALVEHLVGLRLALEFAERDLRLVGDVDATLHPLKARLDRLLAAHRHAVLVFGTAPPCAPSRCRPGG